MHKFKIIFIGVTFTLFINTLTMYAQIDVGADLVSRYVWRGIDYGQSPSIQPSLSFSTDNFEVGFWGAFQLGRDANTLPLDELDTYLAYTLHFESTSLTLAAVDYYFPNNVFKFNDFDDEGNGAHLLEIGAILSGPKELPLYFSGYFNAYNDPDNTMYFEVGYSTVLSEIGIDFFAGATPGGEKGYYNTDEFKIINIGVKATKKIKITDKFSLPIFASYVLNPNENVAHLVFGISL